MGVTCGDVPLQGHRHRGQQGPVLDYQSHRVQVGQQAGEEPETDSEKRFVICKDFSITLGDGAENQI